MCGENLNCADRKHPLTRVPGGCSLWPFLACTGTSSASLLAPCRWGWGVGYFASAVLLAKAQESSACLREMGANSEFQHPTSAHQPFKEQSKALQQRNPGDKPSFGVSLRRAAGVQKLARSAVDALKK